MSGGTIAVLVLGVAAVAGIGYLVLSKPAPAAKQIAPAAGPAGYAQGGNSTVNTVSQVLGIGQQAAGLFGQGVNIYNAATS